MRRVVGLDERRLFRFRRLRRLRDVLLALRAHFGFLRARAPMAAAAPLALWLLIVVAMRARFFFQQRLTVGDRDLVIIGMDFRESEETVAIAAVVDERGLQRGLYARDLGEIDITAQRFLVGRFEIEFLDPVTP